MAGSEGLVQEVPAYLDRGAHHMGILVSEGPHRSVYYPAGQGLHLARAIIGYDPIINDRRLALKQRVPGDPGRRSASG